MQHSIAAPRLLTRERDFGGIRERGRKDRGLMGWDSPPMLPSLRSAISSSALEDNWQGCTATSVRKWSLRHEIRLLLYKLLNLLINFDYFIPLRAAVFGGFDGCVLFSRSIEVIRRQRRWSQHREDLHPHWRCLLNGIDALERLFLRA